MLGSGPVSHWNVICYWLNASELEAFCCFHHLWDMGHSWKAGNPRVSQFSSPHVAYRHFLWGHTRPPHYQKAHPGAWYTKTLKPLFQSLEIILLSGGNFHPFLLFLPNLQFLSISLLCKRTVLQTCSPSKRPEVLHVTSAFRPTTYFPRNKEVWGHRQLPDQFNRGRK